METLLTVSVDGIVDQGGHCSPAECNSPDSSDEMPEVKQFSAIMTRIFADYFVEDFKCTWSFLLFPSAMTVLFF